MSYDIVIIGAGVIGSSIAYNLVNDGFKANKILVLDKDTPANGSTSLSAGGFRNLWTTEVNMKMCTYSIGQYETLQKETDIGFDKAGYLFLKNKRQWKQAKKIAKRQRKNGVKVETLSCRQIKHMIPRLELKLKGIGREVREFFGLEKIVGGIYGPDCGFIEPYRLSTEMLSRAQKAGVNVKSNTEVTGILTSESGVLKREDEILIRENEVSGIKTKDGETIGSGIVINAAGPYSTKVCGMLGIDISTRPINRQIFVTPNPFPDLKIPMIVLDNGAYMRNEMEDLLFGKTNKDEPIAKELAGKLLTHSSQHYYMDEIYPYFLAKLPGLDKGARVKSKWGGLYSVNHLDHNAIIGQHPEIKGFYMAVGFSGHGIMQAAAAGKCISELIMKGKLVTIPEARQLRFERFKENDLVKELEVI